MSAMSRSSGPSIPSSSSTRSAAATARGAGTRTSAELSFFALFARGGLPASSAIAIDAFAVGDRLELGDLVEQRAELVVARLFGSSLAVGRSDRLRESRALASDLESSEQLRPRQRR